MYEMAYEKINRILLHNSGQVHPDICLGFVTIILLQFRDLNGL